MTGTVNPTPNFSFNVPDLYQHKDTWGELLNTNWTDLDNYLFNQLPLDGSRNMTGSIKMANNTYIGPAATDSGFTVGNDTGPFMRIIGEDHATLPNTLVLGTASLNRIRLNDEDPIVFRSAADAVAANLEAPGPTVVDDLTLITAEKGDARYFTRDSVTGDLDIGGNGIINVFKMSMSGNSRIEPQTDSSVVLGAADSANVVVQGSASGAANTGSFRNSTTNRFTWRGANDDMTFYDTSGTASATVRAPGTTVGTVSTAVITAEKGDARYAPISVFSALTSLLVSKGAITAPEKADLDAQIAAIGTSYTE